MDALAWATTELRHQLTPQPLGESSVSVRSGYKCYGIIYWDIYLGIV